MRLQPKVLDISEAIKGYLTPSNKRTPSSSLKQVLYLNSALGDDLSILHEPYLNYPVILYSALF